MVQDGEASESISELEAKIQILQNDLSNHVTSPLNIKDQKENQVSVLQITSPHQHSQSNPLQDFDIDEFLPHWSEQDRNTTYMFFENMESSNTSHEASDIPITKSYYDTSNSVPANHLNMIQTPNNYMNTLQFPYSYGNTLNQNYSHGNTLEQNYSYGNYDNTLQMNQTHTLNDLGFHTVFSRMCLI